MDEPANNKLGKLALSQITRGMFDASELPVKLDLTPEGKHVTASSSDAVASGCGLHSR